MSNLGKLKIYVKLNFFSFYAFSADAGVQQCKCMVADIQADGCRLETMSINVKYFLF